MGQQLGVTTVLLALMLGRLPEASAQVPSGEPSDVGSIAALVQASYETMSGPAGTPRQWPRDSSLYMPGATFVAVRERDGRVAVTRLTAQEYRQTRFPRFEANGLYETEVGRRIERFGNVAQVRSVAVARRTPNGPIDGQYVNYFQLYFDGRRWWIAGMVWDEGRPAAPIPKAWIGHWEEVTR